MKKSLVSMAALLMILAFTPIQSNGGLEKTPSSGSSTGNRSDEVEALVKRVHEINAMDRSAMSASERKELRKEVRTIKRDLKEARRDDDGGNGSGGGVYLSVGAVIIIILLLIILL